MSSMRVSLDVSAVPPQPAGAGRYTLELFGALDARDDVEIVALARNNVGSSLGALAPRSHVADVVPSSRPLRLAYERFVLGSKLKGLDVAVHHGPHYTMPGRCPVPAVVTIHDLTFFDRPELHERTKVHFFRRAITSALNHAAVLVCVSDMTARRLTELFNPTQPVLVAPHGIDTSRFFAAAAPSDLSALDALGLRFEVPRIVQVGTLEPRKGAVELLWAFERLAQQFPDLELVFAGQRGWGLEAFDAALADSAVAHRVRVLGYVPDDAVAALLRTAAVVAYPSIEEGFGLPALEALACGAPVVTTSGSVMAELCGPAPYLVTPQDIGSLAEGLEAALRSSGAERSLRTSQGIERAATFRWAQTAEVHVEAYRLGLERGRR